MYSEILTTNKYHILKTNDLPVTVVYNYNPKIWEVEQEN